VGPSRYVHDDAASDGAAGAVSCAGAQHVHGDAGVGHPRQAGVAEGVSAEVLEAEVADHLVPMSCVAEYRGADPAASWSGEQAGVGSALCGIDALLDEFTDVDDQGYDPCSFAFGALVEQASGGRCGLSAHGP
jgi:hypothetical protein